MTEIRTRFAPSPTGLLHIGSLRSALYEYTFAKSLGGKFILRIEDTDQNRFVPGAVEKLMAILKVFGLIWDEGPEVNGPYAPYIQSERTQTGLYKKYAEQLVADGHAYYCFCPAKSKEEIAEEHEEKVINLRDQCRNLTLEEAKKKIENGETAAIRLRVPDNEIISFTDFILKKEVSWNSDHVDEVMLLKSDGFPTYHLAVVVDDFIMKISHILRAHEWLPSTPVHLLLFKYLGFAIPEIGHMTDILDPEGGKLSKRKRSVSCEDFISQGYLPEAILNFIMLLGWAPKDNREIFTLKELVENFQEGAFQTSNAVFNQAKLDWFNGYYIRETEDVKLKELIFKFYEEKYPEDLIGKIIPIIKDRIVKLSDFATFAGFFFEKPVVDKTLFKDLPYEEHLKEAKTVLNGLLGWTNEKIQEALTKLIEEKGWKTGDFFMSFRIALTGSRFTPPITQSAEILGKEETLQRISGIF